MVMQRRMEYGFNAYPVPVVPRASRSARGRGPTRKKQEEKQIHAFEILASVAGKILRESESSSPNDPTCGKDHHDTISSVINREEDEGLSLKTNPCEHEACDEKTSASMVGLQGNHQISLKEGSTSQDNFSSGFSFTSKNCDRPKRICFAENVNAFGSKSSCGSSSSKVVGDLSHDGEVEDVSERKLEAEPSKVKSIKNETSPVSSSSSDFMELDKKPPIHVGSESDIKPSSLRDCEALGPFPRRANINIVSRDDDEKTFGCSQRVTMEKAYRSPPDTEEQRINESKNWRVSKSLSAGGHSRNDVKPKPIYNCGRPTYARQRSERIVPFKKRKYYHQHALSSSDGGFGCESAFGSPDKIVNDDDCAASGRTHASGASSAVASQQAPKEPRDCNVKLSIKSFKVPELFIEIPATATIGSLKNTVMEAVKAILGDGLHVGILVQGKKVRDDNKTLIQTGISQEDKLHSLGFMLEPRHGKLSSPPYTEDPPLLSGSVPRTLTRHSASWSSQPGISGLSSKSLLTNSSSCTDFDNYSVPSLGCTSNDNNTMSESRALVAVPAISMKALTVVPFHRKSGHPEFVQRRIRRPFSVSEVEALVQAVEKLGTGRWRDVKMRAFDSAKHRTYVDLKDKWKTLVHTARISPQQRRGEPVPQELLDRVLAAHAYWSQQQARQVKSAV